MKRAVTLKSLVMESKDGEWGKGEPFADSVEMAVIRGTDFGSVREGSLGSVPIRHVAKRLAERKTLQANDILIETAGGTRDRPTGRTLLITPSLVRRSEHPLTCASFSRFLRIDPSKADPRYVFWILQHQFEAGRMWQYNTRHTGVARFQYTVFSETEQFGLPDPTTQRKVAAILSAYDDLIANNLRRIKILKEMARAIYREWFVEFRGPGVKLRKATSAEKKAAGKDVFPEGWAVMPIGDVVDTLGGGTPSTKRDEYWEDGDVTWFTPSDLTATGATFIAESGKKITRLGLQKSAARLFPPYSVMMTSRATIGVTAINTGEACTNQGFITCIPNQRVPAVQMYFWIEQHREEIIGVASGATYKEISRSEFREFPIPVADREFGASFVDMMSPLTGQIENLLAKNESLRRTREFLLPRLVSGEVIVRNLNSVTADNPLREVSK